MKDQKMMNLDYQGVIKVDSPKPLNELYEINKFVCGMFCVWSAWPYPNYLLGKQFGVFLSLLWFLTGGYSIFLRKWSTNLVFLAVFTITLIPNFVWGEMNHSPLNHLGVYYLFFLGMFFYHYYAIIRDDKKFLGRISGLTTISYTLGAIQTYVGLTIFPRASRMLASGSQDPLIRQAFTKMGIGGFNFVYGASFLVVMLLYAWCTQRKLLSDKWSNVLFVSVVVLSTTIVKASYTIAILLILLGMLSILIFRNKMPFIVTIVIAFLVLLTARKNISWLLQILASFFSKNQIIFNRINDLARTFLNEPTAGDTSTVFRVNLYLGSLKTFFQQPLFGINGPLGNRNAFIGEHSGWFDFMARYGLFVAIPAFGSIITYFASVVRRFRETRMHFPLTIIFVLFGVYGAINTVFMLYQISLVIFFIIPSLPYLASAFPKEQTIIRNYLGCHSNNLKRTSRSYR